MLRKVSFTAYYQQGEVKYGVAVPGTFHKWGEMIVYKDEKYYPVTVGIVEAENGKVFQVPPDYIVFTERLS